MVGYNPPPPLDWDRVNVTENLGKAAALPALPLIKEIGDEEPCYSTKISIFSFTWAGLAALHEWV